MERRLDYRHGLRYQLAIAARKGRRVLADLETHDVSASGLSFAGPAPHGLAVGDRFEVRLLAETGDRASDASIVMRTQATLIRATKAGGAVRFDEPLQY
jgi:hypothetical protein